MGRKLARILIGALFVGHGTQKLFGWFGGHGPEGTGQFMESLGLKPGTHHAYAAGGAETLGGALFATGLLKPLGAAMLSGTMVTAIRTAHFDKGLWSSQGGFEYNLVLLAGIFSITDHEKGLGWAVAQLAAGAAASTAGIEYAKTQGESQSQDTSAHDGAGSTQSREAVGASA